MNTTCEHKSKMPFIGFHTEITPDKGHKKCPEFWDKEYIEMCSQFGAQVGMTNEEMKEYCEKLFPTLKQWKR